MCAFAQTIEVIYIPNIDHASKLSQKLHIALSVAAKGRPLHVLTKENLAVYIDEHNINIDDLIQGNALAQAIALKAKHLILCTYNDKTHTLETVLYRSDLKSPQAQLIKSYSHENELISALPSLAEQLISYTLLEEGIQDPLAYPLVPVPSGHHNLYDITMHKGFTIGQTEVSQALYMAIMHTNPIYDPVCDAIPPKKSLAAPVSCVSLFDAAMFSNHYSKLLGKEGCYSINSDGLTRRKHCNGCRLPTSEEWIYAAGFGNSYRYAGSDDFEHVAWTQENSLDHMHLPKQKSPNPLGIFDLSGNVAEWTESVIGSNYIVHGGSFRQPHDQARISQKEPLSPSLLFDDQGFRLVCPP